MANAVGGVVGAAIGFAIGGPAGAQWGWAIGAAVGTSFTTVKLPRIGDVAQVRADEGGPRARVYGRFRPIGGNVVWAGKPREIRRRRRQGKGGQRVEQSTILRSYAIGICEGPITGISRIWRNNELVYDVRAGSTMLAESARWLEGKTILLGGWDQLPHPTIEAEVGAADAPAMRGTALLVVTDEDLTEPPGAIPAYQFEVGAGSVPEITTIPPGFRPFMGGGGGAGDPPPAQPSPFVLQSLATGPNSVLPGEQSAVFWIDARLAFGTVSIFVDGSLVAMRSFRNETAVDVRYYFAFRVYPGAIVRIELLRNSVGPGANGSTSSLCVAYTQSLEQLGLPEAGGGEAALLSTIISGICTDTSLPPARFDTSSLPAVFVPGFATSPEAAAVEHLRSLSQVYFFDMQNADGRLRFLPRGGNAVATLVESEFVDGEDEPETDTTRDTMSVPRLLHLSYFDVAGGQGTDKQDSERAISPRVEAPTVLSTPVVLDAATAKRAVTIQHRVMEEELRGQLTLGVSDQRIALVEADVVVVQYRGRSQRARITKVETMDGWQRLTLTRDRQSAYVAASSVQPVPPAIITPPPSSIPGATRFAFLDIPALTQAGDVLSYHVATSGELAGWRGAVVEREEVGAQFGVLATDGTGTVMGTLTAALPLASEWYSDETNAIVVQLARADDDLEAISRDQWLSRGNAAALLRANGTAEVVQFREAVETTPGTWRLTGLLRGRLNSGASAHAAGAVFVLLEGALLVPAGSERLGATLTHRAYSVGNDPTTAVTQARTWTGRSQREWPPIIESAVRTGDSLAVAWTPRHRFGSEESPVASSHFDGWQVDATSGGTTRSVTTLTASATVDVTGLANPITVTVRGRNRLAGLGDPATRILP